MRILQKLFVCFFMVAVSGFFMSFQSNLSTLNDDGTKTELIDVRISHFNDWNGQGRLVAHHPRNINLNIYSGSNYQVDWYTGRGEHIASNTVEIPYVCGQDIVVIVQKVNTSLTGGDDFQTVPCEKSGFEPDTPYYLWENQ